MINKQHMNANLELWFEAVQMMSAVARITQQDLFRIALLAADTAAGVQQGLGPGDGSLQGGQVQEDLGQRRAGEARFLPAFLQRSTTACFHLHLIIC